MGISGGWAQAQRVEYTGAAKWGDGVHPIHAVRDQGRGRQIGAKGTLVPLGEPSDVIGPDFLDDEVSWLCDEPEDPSMTEHYEYLDNRPNWDQITPQFRGATNSAAMGEQPAWGVYNDLDPVDGFPLPGPTGGGAVWLDAAHGEAVEKQRAINVPTMPVTGGWLTKQRGGIAEPVAQTVGDEGFQWTINNWTVQGPGRKSMVNDRAVTRGTDSPRTPITSRTAGMAEKDYAKSFRMGGGAGTPDMYPRQQSAAYKRPFLTRRAALPPDERHSHNTLEGRVPIRRELPPDPYQGDFESSADTDTYGDWY